MKIVHAASEFFPFVKTGGLADVVGAVSRTLADYGHEVAVFLPGYRAVLEHPDLGETERLFAFGVDCDEDIISGEVRRVRLSRKLSLFLICREEYFDRRGLYGTPDRDYEDNAERFVFFNKGVVEALLRTSMKSDIVHCHDWQTALIPLMLRIEENRRRVAVAGKTVLTIHNLAFQGVFPRKVFALTGLPEELLQIDGLEYYGQINFLKGGILFADRLTTVSPTYAREILTPEFGCGLEGVLSSRADDLSSALNGIEQGYWNPETDRYLPANYSVSDLKGKAICRRALLKECGFEENFDGPVFGMVCRFSQQKGIDLLLEARSFFLENRVRLVVLGRGPEHYENAMREFAVEAAGAVFFSAETDERLSHLIEAGSDFFLMPSMFEPCGLNQMYSQRYGTVPVVSRVGGLADTVTDIDASPEQGTGIQFDPVRADNLVGALHRALALYGDRSGMHEVIRRGMHRDFSWEHAARAYEDLYREIL